MPAKTTKTPERLDKFFVSVISGLIKIGQVIDKVKEKPGLPGLH